MLGVAAEAAAVAAVAEDIPEAVEAEEEAVVSPVAVPLAVAASVVAVIQGGEVDFPVVEIPAVAADFLRAEAKGLPAGKVTVAVESYNLKTFRGIGNKRAKTGSKVARISKIPIRTIVRILPKISNKIARTLPRTMMIIIIMRSILWRPDW